VHDATTEKVVCAAPGGHSEGDWLTQTGAVEIRQGNLEHFYGTATPSPRAE